MWHPNTRTARGALAVLALAAPLVAARPLAAQEAPDARRAREAEIAFELQGGTAWSLPTPLIVRLAGARPARLRARYSTRPLADAPYYAYRISRGSPGRAVEAELLHHKLYLENPAPPVERFEVTHGYNLATASARVPVGRWFSRVGLGLVVAHAEGRVAGMEVGRRRTWLGGGYHLAGATAQLALGRRYPFARGATAVYAVPEVKLTAALARIPLQAGSLLVPNVAAHALAGLGVRRRW
jgi:hypothetical protein